MISWQSDMKTGWRYPTIIPARRTSDEGLGEQACSHKSGNEDDGDDGSSIELLADRFHYPCVSFGYSY